MTSQSLSSDFSETTVAIPPFTSPQGTAALPLSVAVDRGPSDPFFSYALQLASRFIGISIVPTLEDLGCDIYYGNDESRPCKLRLPRVNRYHRNTVPRIPSTEVVEQDLGGGPVFPFDPFEAIRFWLSDAGNEGSEARFDVHERLVPRSSAQHAVGSLDTPIVNSYLVLLRTWLEQRLNITATRLYPPPKKCVVILTHDVDDVVDPGDFYHSFSLAGAALRRGSLRRRLSNFRNACRRLTNCNSTDRYWGFHDIMALESRCGFRSTFFFSSVSFIQGDSLDVEYDIRHPRCRSLIRELQAESFEVGLHISYASRVRADRIAAEKAALEHITGREVAGGRHHYWHLSRPMWDSLEVHEQAGLKYDCSVAFNDAPGYRLGIAYPFYPWIPTAGRAVRTLQIPTMLMDGALLYDSNQTVESALDRVQLLLNNLKACNGVAAIDWHEHTSFPGSAGFRKWAEVYRGILNMLAADPEIATMNCEQYISSMQLK